MRMCRRLGVEGKRTIDIPALDVNTYRHSAPGVDYPNTLDSPDRGNVGFYFDEGSGSRRYCRIDFHIPRRVKHLDATFIWPDMTGGYVQKAYVDLYRGEYDHERPPFGSYGDARRLWREYIYKELEDKRADVSIDMALPAGDYSIFFWSEDDNSLRMLYGLTTGRCTMTGYTGSRPE